MGNKKGSRPKGWLVWGVKHPGKGRLTPKTRQLGNARQLKKNAEKDARDWRKKGYIAHVQPSVRTPKRR